MTVQDAGSPALVGPARSWLRSPGRVLVVTVPLIAATVTLLLYRTNGYHIDLEVYRLGVEAWLAGRDMYGELPPTISGLALPFIYPPFAAMVLTPLALMPWTPAWVTLFALSLVSLTVTLYVVARRLWPSGGVGGAVVVTSVALSPALLLEPVRETFEFGQINLVLMAMVAVDCLARAPRWPRGLLVGLAAAIKLTPGAFVLYFLLRRDFRAAGVATIAAAAATGLGFLVDAESSARYWFNGPAHGVSGSIFYTNQTIEAVLARAALPDTLITVIWFTAVVLLLALLVVPIGLRVDPPLALVTVAGGGLLISPTSWSHHWVWIAPALLVTVAYALRLRSPGWTVATLVLAATFYTAPFQFLPHEGGVEATWTPLQQVVGATYVIVAIGLLMVLRLEVSRRSRPEVSTSTGADGRGRSTAT
mgnify:CR=1 FL=1